MCEYITCRGGGGGSLSVHCTCGVLCYIPPQESHSTMKQCVIIFSLAPVPCPCLCLCWSVCASSPSSDPGLSRDAGPGTRCLRQPPLPRRRHPESQAPLAEERHGPAAKIQQTAFSHRWGISYYLGMCCQHTVRFKRSWVSTPFGAVVLNCCVT